MPSCILATTCSRRQASFRWHVTMSVLQALVKTSVLLTRNTLLPFVQQQSATPSPADSLARFRGTRFASPRREPRSSLARERLGGSLRSPPRRRAPSMNGREAVASLSSPSTDPAVYRHWYSNSLGSPGHSERNCEIEIEPGYGSRDSPRCCQSSRLCCRTRQSPISGSCYPFVLRRGATTDPSVRPENVRRAGV